MLKKSMLAIAFLVLGVFLCCYRFNIYLSSLLLLTGIALILCASIFMRETGNDSMIARKLCPLIKNSDCDFVLANGKLTRTITVNDGGIIYFSSQFLFLLMSFTQNDVASTFIFLFPIAIFAFIAGAGLIAYQFFVAHKWCTLCLIINLSIVCQFVILGLNYFKNPISIAQIISIPIVSLFVICFFISLTWLLIKPFVLQSNYVEGINKHLLRWKNNPVVLSTLLKQQQKVNTNPWNNDFLLGEATAPIQIISVLNPYCNACEKEYDELVSLFKSLGNEVSIIIRFNAQFSSNTSKRSIAIQEILNANSLISNMDRKTEILKDWYSHKNILKFKQSWNMGNISVADDKLLKKHEEWCMESNITATPSVFLNGYRVPDIYQIRDLRHLLKRAPDFFLRDTLDKNINREQYSLSR